MKPQDKDRLESAVVERLNQTSEELDMEVLGRLRQSRELALRRLDRRIVPQRAGWAGLALASFCALAIYLGFVRTDGVELSENLLTDSEVLMAQQALDFYNDLDFYLWLDDQGVVSQ